MSLPLAENGGVKTQTWLGTFATVESAHEAYLTAKRRHHEGNAL